VKYHGFPQYSAEAMQQKRNKPKQRKSRPAPLDPWVWSPQNLIEVLELGLMIRDERGLDTPFTISKEDVRTLVSAAKAGLRKGTGPGRTSGTFFDEVHKRMTVTYALGVKARLVADGMSPGEAHDNAAQMASAFARQFFGANWQVDDWMYRIPPLPDVDLLPPRSDIEDPPPEVDTSGI
jgi:hypothetical protein